jgi:hypothetical protein
MIWNNESIMQERILNVDQADDKEHALIYIWLVLNALGWYLTELISGQSEEFIQARFSEVVKIPSMTVLVMPKGPGDCRPLPLPLFHLSRLHDQQLISLGSNIILMSYVK